MDGEEYDRADDFLAANLGDALICRGCGAVVYEVGRGQHDAWHAQLRADLTRLRG